MGLRHLILVLGDQLDPASAAFDGFDPAQDAIWMAEVDEEPERIRCHRRKTALFLSAMRHFRDEQRALGRAVHYRSLPPQRGGGFREALAQTIPPLAPQRLILAWPGDHAVLERLRGEAARLGIPLELREDRHFLCGLEDFEGWAGGRRRRVLDHFYRWMRRRHGLLLDGEGGPVGGRWSLDEDNRGSFGRGGPGSVPPPPSFPPDEITREVIALVDARYPDHPGRAAGLDLPVTRAQARQALRIFLEERLPRFGLYQDAMWAGEPFLYHSVLSTSLNLKLLDPRECLEGASAAWREGRAPLAAAEGFIRQILGWREFVRGIYWLEMPGYERRNELGHHEPLPPLFWDGDTGMACLRDTVGQILEHGYAHHIQRLMVVGLFALQLGVDPLAFHRWHMSMYVDAIDWVSAPNALGMSQHADGGLMATKPYCASGRYLQRMGNHCGACRYRPEEAVGERACPFTTLYWEFLDRHAERLRGNPRMKLQVQNMSRKSEAERAGIRARAGEIRAGLREGVRW